MFRKDVGDVGTVENVFKSGQDADRDRRPQTCGYESNSVNKCDLEVYPDFEGARLTCMRRRI